MAIASTSGMTGFLRKSGLRILLGLIVTALLAGHALGYYQVRLLTQLETLIYDTRIRLDANQGPDPRIVILDIDEASLASPELGRWPWSRDRMAELVDRLFDDYGIKVLAFDVVFAEPDRSSGLDTLDQLATGALADQADFLSQLDALRSQLDFDQRFRDALSGRPVVTGFYFTATGSDEMVQTSGELPFPALFGEDLAGTTTALPAWSGYGANLPGLAASALLSGHFNPLVDPDGIVRRLPLLIEYEGDYYESLALASFRLHLAIDEARAQGSDYLRLPSILASPYLDPEVHDPSTWPLLERLMIDQRIALPVDLTASALVPYRGGPKTFDYVSLVDVLEGTADPERLRDRIAIVGTTAPGLMDLRATPVSGIYPGVEVHANLLSALLDQAEQPRLKQDHPAATLLELGGLIIAGVLLSLLFARFSPAMGVGLFLVSLVTVVAGSQWFWVQGYLVDIAGLLVLILLLFMIDTAYALFIESRSKRQFTALFGQYVPPELVEQMAADPERYSMEGRKAELTVLFSDVEGFTTISEQLNPTELSQYINDYLTAMSALIRDAQGTLDKYIGDAIMAFWGAPVETARHAHLGVVTAMAMQARTRELNESFVQRGWPELKIGIGLSTGDMTVGDMGSQVRKAYTVMGDAVNLGARLEGLTRVYGAKILVPESTMRACPDIVFREIDRVRVKGKLEPVVIYTPLVLRDQFTDQQQAELDDWQRMLEDYRAQHWDHARARLAALTEVYGSAPVYVKFAERIDLNEAAGLPTDWDGVTTFKTK